MKRVISKITILALVISLTACSTNTREQNTLLGAGTGAVAGGLLGSLAHGAGAGWVVAAGVVAGGLLGGMIGNSMDSTDNRQVYVAMNNPMNHPNNWVNHNTGNWYKIVPTSNVYAYHGYTYCRQYTAYGRHNGQTVITKGVACRTADGLWQQIR